MKKNVRMYLLLESGDLVVDTRALPHVKYKKRGFLIFKKLLNLKFCHPLTLHHSSSDNSVRSKEAFCRQITQVKLKV